MPDGGFFHRFVEDHRRRGELIVQSRMGFSRHSMMRRGLEAVAGVDAPTIGTITVDSKTRTGDLAGARRALDRGVSLNGYPIASYSTADNRRLIEGLYGPGFPIQVRHGSARPDAIFRASMDCGLDAMEGGPISYCLPYGRTPLAESIATWDRCCRSLAALQQHGITPHLESFGGCMMGQLCPPSLLVAITLIEGLAFARKNLQSISLSYAQCTNSAQDIGALLALRQLAEEYLPDTTWHVVVYTFMGLFPRSHEGALELLRESVRITRLAACERLIVKTASEAREIPEIERNVEALELAARITDPPTNDSWALEVAEHQKTVLEEARHLVEAVLELDPSIDRAIVLAFYRGFLDVPYCLHPDNRNEARAVIDAAGVIRWKNRGKLPLPAEQEKSVAESNSLPPSEALRVALSFNRNKYDKATGRRRGLRAATG